MAENLAFSLADAEDDSDFLTQTLPFHPKAIRPSFVWTAKLPTNWAFLDTHPASWQRQVERIIDQFYSGQRLKVADRKAIRAQLEKAVQASQDNKVLLTFVLPGLLDDGHMSACTLMLRWQSFSPQSASMSTVDRAFSGKEGFTHRTTAAGAAYALFGGVGKTGPLIDRRDIWNYQAVLPVTSTSWAVVVSGTAPTQELGEMMRDVVARVADGINTFPEETGRLVDADVSRAGQLHAGDDGIVLAMPVE